jgi:hypothetical protein
MHTRSRKIMFLGSRVQPVRGADNLTAICEPISRRCGILNISQPHRPPRPVTGIALLYILTITGAITFAIPSLKPVIAICFLMLKHGEPNYSLLGYDTVVWAAQYVILKC